MPAQVSGLQKVQGMEPVVLEYHITHMILNATLANPNLFLTNSLIMRKLQNFSMVQMLHILGEY
jgi:2-succinyl-5-enolpyruvyl-6-hydroxy-3-cyclohexene-1-carboxylate synthase